MEGIDTAARRRTLDLPAKPEAGLAEWTSKIKALQKQVDDDEEAEHRRLEEEIAASRMARMRRSTGSGSRANSVDLSKTDVATSLKNMDTSTSSTSNRSRQQNQEDAMKKLTGEDMQTRIRHALQPSAAPPSGTSLAAFMGGKASAPRLTRHAPQQDAHDPTQFEQRTHVAAPHPVFGRGGIALPGMTAYSGRNAISTSPPSQVSGSSSHSDAEFTHHRDRKTSTPSGVRAIVAKAEEMRSSTSHKVPQPQDIGVRQRTMSTPTGSYPARSPNLPTQQSKAEESQSGRYTPRAISRSPAPLSQSPAPPSSRTPVPPSISPAPPSRSPAPLSPSVPLRPTTPQERRKSFENSTSVRTPHSPLPPRSPGIPASSQCSSPSLAKQPVTTPSLSHPVQPQQKPVFNGPKLPAASSTSVAFLKPPVEKEPTPSISRLQGRGFVQNMVKASSQLSSGSTLEGSPIPRQATSTPDTGKKTPVLDRWQFDNGRGAGSPSPPIISPKPVPIRKSRTLDPSQSLSPSSPVPTPFHSESSGRYLKSTSSLPSIAQPRTPDPSSTRMSSSKSDVGAITPSARPKTPAGANGTRWTSSKSDVGVVSPSSRPKTPAGSSTTLISYIKPTKTGDSPPTTSSPATPAPTSKATSAPPPAVDEMGVRVRPRSKSISAEASEEGHVKAPSANGDSGGKPLAHPTKDRAKKPRKAKGTTKEASTESFLHEPQAVSQSAPSAVTPSFHAQRPLTPQSAIDPEPSRAPHLQIPEDMIDPRRSPSPLAESPSPLDGRHSPGQPQNGSQAETSPWTFGPSATEHNDRPAPSPKAKKHNRIPSTGNRATVMDVAQALQEHEKHVRELSGTSSSKYRSRTVAFPDLSAAEDVPIKSPSPPPAILPEEEPVAQTQPVPRTGALSPGRLEQRKSSYEKYSAFIMPPLAEETTPVQSPAGTLARGVTPDSQTLSVLKEEIAIEEPIVGSHPSAVVAEDDVYIRRLDNGPLPPINIDAILAPESRKSSSDIQTISVDLLSIFGTTATPINRDQNIFYDHEVLLIVHRLKMKSTGLVSTSVWSWYGKKSNPGEREERKIQEMARRYNTTLIPVRQYAEPTEMVTVLGGQLAIRQGTRARWSRENTAMHIVRSSDDVTFIDEIELGSRNLCSGFSYCLSLLETFYVWYGKGSNIAEKEAALKYARDLTATNSAVIELTEGENDDDEMFWMMLGEQEYARADYWQWRGSLTGVSPRLWRLEDRTHPVSFNLVYGLTTERQPNEHIYLADCVLEYYILVGKEARDSLKKIRLALSAASELSSRTQHSKPFAPPVHVLIFPSQIPEDLRLTFRDLDDFDSEQSPYPDHINLLSLEEAHQHLQQATWSRSLVKDTTMLPLGIHPSDL